MGDEERGELMKQHPRTSKVHQAHLEASATVAAIWSAYDLTWGEIVAFHARELQSTGKYLIREERHPGNPDRPGDQE